MALADCFTKSDPEAANNQGTALFLPPMCHLGWWCARQGFWGCLFRF